MNRLKNTITALSHEFGTADYVRGGGGNTSVKNADTLWVKPSGATLGGMRPEDFVPMSRRKLAELYTCTPPADPAAREAMVKKIMTGAVLGGHGGRPSVEAQLHDSFEATYIVHTHPTFVTGLLAAAAGASACRGMFPEALWLDYADPGYTLSMACRKAMEEYADAHGHQPDTVFLQNHGVFIAGDNPDDIRRIYQRIMDALAGAYAEAGIPTDPAIGPRPLAARVETVSAMLREAMGAAAAHVRAAGSFDVAEGPISPDHIVYSGSFSLGGEPTAEALSAFREKHGRAPRVVATAEGVFGIGATERQAAMALEFAEDGALVRRLAEAFGGVRYMDENAWRFIESWEGEAYRARVAFGDQ